MTTVAQMFRIPHICHEYIVGAIEHLLLCCSFHLIYIGTPHIAGYSADGKANATRMALTALCNHFHLPVTFQIRVPQLPEEELPEPNLTETERALVLYNPHTDSLKLKSHPTMFEELRGNYPLRREFIE